MNPPRGPQRVKPLTHGTVYAYREGCRCDECRAAKAAVYREFRRRRMARVRAA